MNASYGTDVNDVRIGGKMPHHLRVDGDLGEASAFAPKKRVSLVAEQSLPHTSRRDGQQVAILQCLHTLLLGTVHHTEHLQQQFEP